MAIADGLIVTFPEELTLITPEDSYVELIVPTGVPGEYTTKRTSIETIRTQNLALTDQRDYVATEGQTSFDVIYETVQVYVGGLLLTTGEYTADNGVEITLNIGVPAGTSVQVIGTSNITTGVLPQSIKDVADLATNIEFDLAAANQTANQAAIEKNIELEVKVLSALSAQTAFNVNMGSIILANHVTP